MVSKRKKPPVRKAHSVTPEQPKSDKQRSTAEELIQKNGELVESFLASEVYAEIVGPLISESIASVSGRFTNGRYHHGSLTRMDATPLQFLQGYQKAMMDLNNRIHDFVLAKDDVKNKAAQEKLDKDAPVYNPFMEEE